MPHKNGFFVSALSATESETSRIFFFSKQTGEWWRGCFEFHLRKRNGGEGKTGKREGTTHNKFHRGISERIARNLRKCPAFRALAWRVISFIARYVRVGPCEIFRSDFRTKLILWFSIRHPAYVLRIAYVSHVHFSYVPIYGGGRARDKFCKVTPAIFIPSSCALSTLYRLSFVRIKRLFKGRIT